MTKQQQAKYEKIIRRLRNNMFKHDELYEDRCSRLIEIIKIKLNPVWEQQHKNNNDYHWMYAAE